MSKLVKHGHIPVRTCLVCMRKKPKGDLVRLGLDPQTGSVRTDFGQRMSGRGGYACRECLSELRLNKRVQRAFRNKAVEVLVGECPIQPL